MISIKNISKSFGEIQVLDEISLSFSDNTITSLLAPSGSGKSTLLRCIAGLEKVNSGEIISKTINKIGIVFQNFNLFPHLTAFENITISQSKKSSDLFLNKASDLMEMLGIEDLKDKKPSELSGGQKQRVAIARALILDPEILLFDEPTSALDPEKVFEVGDIIKKLKKHGRTIIVATHELRLSKKISDRIVFMDKGRVESCQNTKDFFENPDSERVKKFINNMSN